MMAGFTFNEDIPQSTDIISESQPEILQNFTSIDNIWGVDHYTFETGTDGKHKQVTFAGNNVPTGTVSPPVLFTNIKDGAGNDLPNLVPELFFYSGTVAQGQNNYVSQTNGSVLLFGGIILKWGLGNGSNLSPSFTPQFPSAAFVGFVIAMNNARTLQVQALSQTNITVAVVTGGSLGPGDQFYWMAIGN